MHCKREKEMIEHINCEVLKASDEAPDDDLTILALAVKPRETLQGENK